MKIMVVGFGHIITRAWRVRKEIVGYNVEQRLRNPSARKYHTVIYKVQWDRGKKQAAP